MNWRRAAGEAGTHYKQVRRGWCLGGQSFRPELLGRLTKDWGGKLRRGTLTGRAERIVAEELQRLHRQEDDLSRRAKGDAAKVEWPGPANDG